eukprot:Hpha_TRINITY_DN16903_c3_g15::TRINITY_DN16903_c3_g15_i1::g.53564::m.53564
MGKTVFLKGYAGGLDFPSLGGAKGLLLQMMRQGAYDTVVWDGDPYKPDSFTSLLPEVAHALPEARLVALKILRDVQKCREGWEAKLQGRAQVEGVDVADFVALGRAGLEKYGEGADVFFFGGGKVAREELKNMLSSPEKGMQIHVLHDVRRGDEDSTPLLTILRDHGGAVEADGCTSLCPAPQG